jgi:hypothetical protein
MPHLYLLKRGLSSLKSASQNMILFSSPTNDGKSAIINGKLLTLAALKVVHDDLLNRIETELDLLLWGGFKIPEDAYIHDEPRELSAGYGFVNEQMNSWKQEKSVVEHILTTTHLRSQFADVDDEGNVFWLPGACMQRMRAIYNLQVLIGIGILLTGGEPARASEYVMMLLVNIAGGSIRNIFWLFNTFIMRGSYNKTSHFTGEDKTMVRVPLPRLGRLIARFLVYLRPLYCEWQYHFRPTLRVNAQTFLFAGLYRPVTGWDISLALAKYTEHNLGIRLTIRTFRQFMAYIVSWHWRILKPVHVGTNYAHLQLGHTGAIDSDHYGGDAQLPEGLTRVLFMETARVSAILHIIFGHPPELLELLNKGGTFSASIERVILGIERIDLNSVLSPECVMAPAPHILDTVADAVSTRVVSEVINQNKRALVDAHASVVQMFYRSNMFSRPSEPTSSSVIYPHPYLLAKLRHFLDSGNENLGFKNIQQGIVTQLMYERKMNILYISPTGEYFVDVCAYPR